jgi:hypothetical protein
MAILPDTPGRLRALTRGMTTAQLHAPPEPDAWSVSDVLAHLRACHDVLGGNVLRILAEDHPSWQGMSPRAYLKKTDYQQWEFEPAFAVFAQQRAELLNVLDGLPPANWERTAHVIGMLRETYEYSARYYANWMAGHERRHLKTLPRIIAAAKAKA